uniref:Phosphoinositide 3-kinase regulatory subunit 5 n=1 Tax=Gasterosteus aculeatus aculeatus TaxID=481459 RepID=A0AAQ4QYP2_GASAC
MKPKRRNKHCVFLSLSSAGLCINRWCLEELVKRDAHNFLILLQKILRKTTEVIQQCRYELVVPLTLLFSSTLLKAPHVAPDCGLLEEAYLLFHRFLAWPEPCSSASKTLLKIIQKERRAPGISFHQLVRTEQGICPEIQFSKTITVLLVNPDECVPPEVRSISEKISGARRSGRDVAITLVLHSFQASLGATCDLRALHAALQTKRDDELDQLAEAVTDHMEAAASAADPETARRALLHVMEKLRDRVAGAVETFMLPFPKCHTCSWENDNFDFLKDILSCESDLDSPPDCFLENETDNVIKDTSVDGEDGAEGNKEDHELHSHRVSTASSSSRDSSYSLSSSHSLSSSWSAVSTPSGSSGVESDFSEDTDGGPDSRPKLRKKPKKKSRSILDVPTAGLNSLSLCRQVRPLHACAATRDPLSPRKHMCVRRRPIMSCDEGDAQEAPTLVKVVVFGGDKEAGRLARAYSDLQQKESKCPRLTKTCKLRFYLVPTKRRATGSSGGHASPESNGSVLEDGTQDIAQMLGMMDPWYERNVLSLLSLSSDVLFQTACKDDAESVSGEERLPLLADMVLYYCRHADQPVLVQLYQAELTLAGGERRKEVFIHSLELGHTAGTRAVKAMGSASKRFGIDEEREAVPLTLSVAYNKVVVNTRIESLQLTMTEVVKRQSSKSKKGYNQIYISEVKVDKVQVHGGADGATFAVCLDQDEKKFIQSVTRCEVSLCSKQGSSSDWKAYKPSPGQVQPLHPSYCSLLCLPITSFSASCP